MQQRIRCWGETTSFFRPITELSRRGFTATEDLFHVVACAERAAAASDHQNSSLTGAHGIFQISVQLIGQRVHGVGTIKGNHADMVCDFVK